ncbi:hypothetical protein C4D60_Mb04t11320 [Musa balbisiana]|uniref:Uncharacterized protein n=1 Tax=Musa balbisiana TaxID=52838 RepID=A0A4S8KB92_MUSBA|nr:hypothetical protein C4D60_Mb04t11320 [Musa balbisiana]
MVVLVGIRMSVIHGGGQRCGGMRLGAGELDLPNVTRQLYGACHHVTCHGAARHHKRHLLQYR